MAGVFNFKRFQVNQDGCAMKINTDGVLLGALAGHANPGSVLDIGTGTGVIALMLAQRYSGALIDAVEIDHRAAATARINFSGSPFAARMQMYASSIEQFRAVRQYDLIVSNPPYFVNDLKNAEKAKEIARHAPEDFFDLLLRKCARLLTEKGCLWLILPVKQAEQVRWNAARYQLYPSKIYAVHSDALKEPFREIICLEKHPAVRADRENIYIYAAQNQYTDWYKELLADFFLAF